VIRTFSIEVARRVRWAETSKTSLKEGMRGGSWPLDVAEPRDLGPEGAEHDNRDEIGEVIRARHLCGVQHDTLRQI
jgi:hypothetical protein